MFNIDEYKKALNSGIGSYMDATESLELAIKKADISEAIKLKKLRTPGKVTSIELKRLKASGFNMDKTTSFGGENISDSLVLAFHAGFEHAKINWPHLVEKYDMSMYPLSYLED